MLNTNQNTEKELDYIYILIFSFALLFTFLPMELVFVICYTSYSMLIKYIIPPFFSTSSFTVVLKGETPFNDCIYKRTS